MADIKLVNKDIEAKTTIGCMICGEAVELNYMEEQMLYLPYKDLYKICDKCKDAVLKMRAKEENNYVSN